MQFHDFSKLLDLPRLYKQPDEPQSCPDAVIVQGDADQAFLGPITETVPHQADEVIRCPDAGPFHNSSDHT
jgi:hypothetical protein